MQNFLRIARLFGDAFALFSILFGLWGFVRALFWGQGEVTPGLSLTPGFAMQIYAPLIVIGLIFLAGLHWNWLQSKRPAVRFRLMSEDINGTRQSLGQAYGPRTGPLPAHVEPKIRKIAHGLDDFKTPYPQITGENSHQEWSSFLIRLQPASEMGNLDYAKSIWKELQEEAAKSVI